MSAWDGTSETGVVRWVVDGLAGYRFEPAEAADGLGGSPRHGDAMFFMPGPHRLQRPGIRSADAIIDGLLAIGHPVLTFDPPGSGRSLRPAHLGFDEMIGCTDEVLDRFKVGAPIDAIGHSMGGLALLAYTLVRPDRIRRLVLVGTGAGGYLNAPGALWNASHSRFRTLAALGLLQQIWPRRGPEQILRNFVERESFVDRGLAQPVAVAGRDWLRPRIGRTDWHRFAREVDLQPRLAEIAAPTLVLCGMHDPQFPLVCSLRLVEGIPQSRLVTFLDSGHYPFIEEASSFWAAVDRFLAVRTPHVEPRVEATGAVAALASGRRVGAAVGLIRSARPPGSRHPAARCATLSSSTAIGGPGPSRDPGG